MKCVVGYVQVLIDSGTVTCKHDIHSVAGWQVGHRDTLVEVIRRIAVRVWHN
jgi:hypothetical protein